MQTIKRLLVCGLKNELHIFSVSGGVHYLKVTSGMPVDELVGRLRQIEIDVEDPDIVLFQGHAPQIDKFDIMVPDHLLRKAFLFNELDVNGVVNVFREL